MLSNYDTKILLVRTSFTMWSHLLIYKKDNNFILSSFYFRYLNNINSIAIAKKLKVKAGSGSI